VCQTDHSGNKNPFIQDHSPSSSSTTLRTALAFGFGLGLPLFVILIVLFGWWNVRRNRRKEAKNSTVVDPRPVFNPGSEIVRDSTGVENIEFTDFKDRSLYPED
jgi:hypothetical protein